MLLSPSSPLRRILGLPKRFADKHDRLAEPIVARDLDAADLLSKARADKILRQIQGRFVGERHQEIYLQSTCFFVDK